MIAEFCEWNAVLILTFSIISFTFAVCAWMSVDMIISVILLGDVLINFCGRLARINTLVVVSRPGFCWVWCSRGYSRRFRSFYYTSCYQQWCAVAIEFRFSLNQLRSVHTVISSDTRLQLSSDLDCPSHECA